MVTNISYNNMIDRLRAFADGHYLIKQFTHGQIDLRYLEQGADYYPWMHVIPGTITPQQGLREYSFDITFSDLTRDKEHEAEYIREAISDCTRLAEDLLAEIKNGNVLFDSSVQIVDGSTITPFIHEDTHTLTGVTLSCAIRVPWDWSACDIPADYAPGGSGSGGSGGGGGCCVTLQVGGVDNIDQTLLNLIAGTNMTITDNGDGSVTFDSSGGGSVSWGAILGTLSNQTDLQNALNLKADISSLATVATTGDYNDLINTPVIPTGTVTSVGLSMPAAFTVTNSPVTTSGTLTVTGAGNNLQLIDGTGALQTIPTGLPPTGNAGGDLTGTYPNPTVHRIHGIDMQSGTPSADETWVYGGSPAKWQHQHLNASQVVNDSAVTGSRVDDALDHLDSTKQATLVSGTNIKTVNSTSLLGSGNISVGTVTSVTGTSPISSSGGNTPAISIADAAADGTTKGAATFNANDFNATSGVISIDYTNGQSASASTKGFLTASDFTTLKRDTFTLQAFSALAAPADNTTYYFSTEGVTLSTNATLYDSLMPYACTLIGAIIHATNTSVTATNEASTLNFRLNNTTDTLLSNTIVVNGTPPVSNVYNVTGLSTSIAAGDTFVLKWTTPTWATNPNSMRLLVILFFERA